MGKINKVVTLIATSLFVMFSTVSAQFKSLFNGNDLTGWTIHGTERWYVENGELVCESGADKAYGYLSTETPYKNFILSLEFKLEANGNSGVFIRSDIEGTTVNGWQVEVAPPNLHTGGIYESYGRGWLKKPDAASEKYLNPDGWNTMKILADGNQVSTWLNGHHMVTLDDEKIGSVTGFIALQIHDGGGIKVRWKNIQLLELPQVRSNTDPLLLVVNKHSSTLSLIDAVKLELIETIATGPNPHEIAVSPDQRYAYLSNFAAPGNTISVVDLKNRKHVKQIETGEHARIHGAAMAPDGLHAYFTAGQSAEIIEVDTRTNTFRRAIPSQGATSHMVYVSPDGTRLYVANTGSDNVSVLDRKSGDLITLISVGKAVAGMAFTNNGDQLWALNQAEGSISIIDVATNRVIETVASPQMPTRIRFTPDGKRALIAHWHEQGALSVVDVETKREIKRIPVGKLAIGVGISPDGKWAFVGCEDAGKATKSMDGTEDIEPTEFSEGVHVINLETLRVEKVIKTGLGPDAMTICFPPE